MSSRGFPLAPPAKKVVVHLNGDPFSPGRNFVVTQRRLQTLETFLNEVTRSIRAPLAVRNLYTPRHGHRVAELGDLQDGGQYVAAGFEKFKKLKTEVPGCEVPSGDEGKEAQQGVRGGPRAALRLCRPSRGGSAFRGFAGTSGARSAARRASPASALLTTNPPGGSKAGGGRCPRAGGYPGTGRGPGEACPEGEEGTAPGASGLFPCSHPALQFPAGAPWKPRVPARRPQPARTIRVFRNGDLLSPPFPVLLSRNTLLQWDTLLATLTKKLELQSGAVHRLCRLDGTQVSAGEELVSGHYYVAVGSEEYKELPYLELLVPQDSVWQGQQRSQRRLWQGKGKPVTLRMKSTD
ncbi:doublecortin domain-containing protein 2B [Apus apus]|uniref:doublecortin domain-containing protein 2B n=1 Tax=Apus apus TaxID=8895 RepID=UPI0021F8A742|nr:doublecortin domain-containing protein 2B [Apus apus]